MTGKLHEADALLGNGPQSVLERTLVAEYLAAKGYLMCELQALEPKEAQALMREACQFAALRLAEIESREAFQRKIKFPFSYN